MSRRCGPRTLRVCPCLPRRLHVSWRQRCARRRGACCLALANDGGRWGSLVSVRLVWMHPARASTWVGSRRGTPPTRAATWRCPWGRAASSCRWGPRRCRCSGLAPTVLRGVPDCATLTADPRQSSASWSCLRAAWRPCRRPATTWDRWVSGGRNLRLSVRLGLCRIAVRSPCRIAVRVKQRVKHLRLVVLCHVARVVQAPLRMVVPPDVVVALQRSVTMCVVPGPPPVMRPFTSMRLAPIPRMLTPPFSLVRMPPPMFQAIGHPMLVCQVPPYVCWTITSLTRARDIPRVRVCDKSASWPHRVCWRRPCQRRCSSIHPSMSLTSRLAGLA